MQEIDLYHLLNHHPTKTKKFRNSKPKIKSHMANANSQAEQVNSQS